MDSQIAIDGDDVYWVENRPAEAGRSVLVRWTPGRGASDVTPAPFNVRTRVHEYGGGSFVVGEGAVYFSNFSDQRLYSAAKAKGPEPITPASALRYADGTLDMKRGRLVCVLEDHTESGREAANRIAAVSLDGKTAVKPLVSGNDFYASPRISPDGDHMAWLTWAHPNMPWDAAELWIGKLAADGSVSAATRVAGGMNQSVCQPRFSPDGTLYFIWEKTGWWNLYRWTKGNIEPLCEMEAEFGAPAWTLGGSLYAFQSPDRIVCSYSVEGQSRLAFLDTATRNLRLINLPHTSINSVQAAERFAVIIAGSANAPPSVIRLDLESEKEMLLRRSVDSEPAREYVSVPRAIEFPTDAGQTAHAFFYPPANPAVGAPWGEKPPLIVISHGGPTSSTTNTLNLSVQYWTSRGFAVVDVNYGGSNGYGGDYRRRLDGNWGVVDVNDCVNCALYLVARGDVDGDRIAIRGGSAGGYTTLSALTFRDVFRAGASYYGVSDLEALAKETHKFESRYLDRLIGPYPSSRDKYVERSPVNFPDRLSCPVIFFQGDEDKVVPPNQAEMMFNALREKGVPVAYLVFPGEQHGFRRAENIKRALDAELYFYSRVFGFGLPDPVEPVRIENL